MNRAAAGTEGSASTQQARAVYARLLRYARPYIGMYLLGVLGMMMYAGTDLLTISFTKTYLQNSLALEHDRSILRWLPLWVLGIFAFRGIGDYLANYFPYWVGRQVIKAIRTDLFVHYLRLPTATYDHESTGGMLSRLTYNAESVASATTDSLTVIIRDSLAITFNVAALFWLNWQLAIYALFVAPAIAWLVRNVNIRFRRYSKRIQNSMGDVTRVVKEALDAHRVVKVFNAQDHIGGLFESVNELNRRTNVRLISARSSSNPIVQMIAAVGLASVLFIANQQMQAGTLSVARFIPFLIALFQVTQPLKRVLAVSGPMQQGIAAGQGVFEVLDAPSEPAGGKHALGRARGEVEFRDVGFEYVAEKGSVLRDISLKVPPGTTVAIVGRSGSGKSTLVSLLPRFYDPTSGLVLIDGVDIREYSLFDLRRQISLVSQEVMLFNDTIRNNILFGATDISDAQLEAAARAAYVMEFIEQQPHGLDTLVGDRGVLLSGGQRQRISIARALLRDTPILILDEATSALDTAAERHIQAAVDQLVRNRTTFIIAHRLSTVEHADRILVLRDGLMVEYGAHTELLQHRGVYAELHRMQFSA
ncbi:MAG TPA: lipid A export permease/ATP-binding protein MsbA [Steroidobacteraceae bacterium]